jgi:adenine-specific DNA-methyltransferase
VLDFFAGSCGTAQAVLEANIEDGGSRRFIMVQLPEPAEGTSNAAKAGFRTIAEIGKERIRKVAKKISAKGRDQLDLNKTQAADLGFKVFKLDRSNFRIWNGDAAEQEALGRQIEMHIDHLSATSSAEDVLYELLLKAGFPLTTKVASMELAGKQVFSVEDGTLLICLDKEITSELIDALADANPLQVICLDEGFKGNDQLKTNAVQTFKARAQAEESEIVFKTV